MLIDDERMKDRYGETFAERMQYCKVQKEILQALLECHHSFKSLKEAYYDTYSSYVMKFGKYHFHSSGGVITDDFLARKITYCFDGFHFTVLSHRDNHQYCISRPDKILYSSVNVDYCFSSSILAYKSASEIGIGAIFEVKDSELPDDDIDFSTEESRFNASLEYSTDELFAFSCFPVLNKPLDVERLIMQQHIIDICRNDEELQYLKQKFKALIESTRKMFQDATKERIKDDRTKRNR